MIQTIEVEVARPDNRDEVDKYELHFNLYKHELVAIPEREEIVTIINELSGYIKKDDEGNESFDENHFPDIVYRLERLMEIIIRISYGEMVETNVSGDQPSKHFVKSEEITKRFETTDVYHVLVDYLLSNPELALKFVTEITNF